jgi:hypothetical protein
VSARAHADRRPDPSATGEPQLPARAGLRRLGRPEDLVPAGLTGTLQRALVARLANLPQPKRLPTGKGTIVAVCGERGDAVALARLLAERAGRGGERVVLASASARPTKSAPYECLRSAEAAAEERRSWRWRPGPTFVAVEAPIGRRDEVLWASELLAVLEPHQAWGAAPSSRKVEDIAAWAATLGDLDALSIHGMDETTSPAAILQLGVPVGLLDGVVPSAELWAELLCERLVLG